MKITVLVDNHSLSPTTRPENGLSLFLDAGDICILFDTGRRNLIVNAHQLDIDLTRVTHIILSHGHHDHTSGLPHLLGFYKSRHISPFPVIICHPDAFDRRGFYFRLLFRSICLRSLNSPMTKNDVLENFPTIFSKEPIWINPQFVFLGEIPRNPQVDEECVVGTIQKNEMSIKDRILDDSALVYKSSEGIIILSGCAHSGICNIVEYAKKICADERVLDILGGFHLKYASRARLDHVKNYLSQLHLKSIHACHCTGKGRNALPNQQNIGIGTSLTYPE